MFKQDDAEILPALHLPAINSLNLIIEKQREVINKYTEHHWPVAICNDVLKY